MERQDVDFWDRQQACLAAGLPPELMLAWSWCWAEAGFAPRKIIFQLAELATGCWKQPRAAGLSVDSLESHQLVRIIERRTGRGGYIEAYINDPLDVFNAPRVVRPSPQREFPFAEELDGNAQSTAPCAAPLRVVTDEVDHENAQSSAPCAARLVNEATGNAQSTAPWTARFPLPRITTKLRDALGEERWDLWLADAHIAESGATLTVAVPTDFAMRRLAKMRREICEIGLAIDEGFRLDLTVDPSIETGNAQSTAPWTARLATQRRNEVKEDPSSFPLKGKEEEENEQRKPARRAAAGKTLIAAAKRLYDRIDDPDCYKWIALLAAAHIDQGTLRAEDVERLADECAGTPDFRAELRTLAGKHIEWGIRPLRRLLRRSYGLKWNPDWEAGAAGKRPRQRRG